MNEELDVARCSLRIKQDRRDGRTGIYLGFERRGRLSFGDELALRPSSLQSGDGSQTVSSRADRQTAAPIVKAVTRSR